MIEPREGSAIIQFIETPSESLLGALSQRGVKIINFIPNNAVVAVVPTGVDVYEIDGIRWAGKLKPEDKISSSMDLLKSDGHALVDFFSDVDASLAELIITGAEGTIIQKN